MGLKRIANVAMAILLAAAVAIPGIGCISTKKVANTATFGLVGDKEDITSDFLFVLEQYIPKQTSRTIVCGESESTVLHITNTKEGYEKAIKYLQERLTTAST